MFCIYMAHITRIRLIYYDDQNFGHLKNALYMFYQFTLGQPLRQNTVIFHFDR